MREYKDILSNNKFDKYYSFLVTENEKYNLTTITDKDDVYIKHFYDSLQLENLYDFNQNISLCDVGSGAGFPSIPLKIMYPNLKVTIIEPTQKRCNFLKMLVKLLELDDVTIICDRAENIKGLKFDVVCARAVSSLPILLELCIPLVKKDGLFYAMKGSSVDKEIEESKDALKILKSKIIKEYEYSLEKDNVIIGTYKILEIKKYDNISNMYPRPYAQIKKKHL